MFEYKIIVRQKKEKPQNTKTQSKHYTEIIINRNSEISLTLTKIIYSKIIKQRATTNCLMY